MESAHPVTNLDMTTKFSADPRYFQIGFQFIFILFGIFYLGWTTDWLHYIITITGCLFFNYASESIKSRLFLPLIGNEGWRRWGFSILISALSICLLLKVNHWYTSLLAAFLTVISKYVLRIGKKHLFNPSAFGIVITILVSRDAWLSPGQWGTNAVLFFLIITLGTIVVTRVQKLDVSLSFLICFGALLFWRQVYQL